MLLLTQLTSVYTLWYCQKLARLQKPKSPQHHFQSSVRNNNEKMFYVRLIGGCADIIVGPYEERRWSPKEGMKGRVRFGQKAQRRARPVLWLRVTKSSPPLVPLARPFPAATATKTPGSSYGTGKLPVKHFLTASKVWLPFAHDPHRDNLFPH